MHIFSIGGGSVGEGETLGIDRAIIAATGKPNPTALFIPTASEDSEDYIANFTATYAREGCKVEVLRLLSKDNPETAKTKIERADLVYVGGGNTKMMLELWRANGVDKLLETHGNQGKPLSGLSAGAICWYRVANSDWPLYYPDPQSNTAPLDGLGWVDLAICPHTRDEGFRLKEFSAMMRDIPGAGIGLDDCCAIEVLDDQYRILATQSNAFAHRIFWFEDTMTHELIEPHEDLRPLQTLQDIKKAVGQPMPLSV